MGPKAARRSTPPWEGRRVVLGVTGGIACYKSIWLARELTLRGADVDVVMTPSASAFLRPLVFEGVTGRPVLTSLWSADGAARHLKLAEEADVVVVAPATADFLARVREGRADDLLTTLLLATRAPVLVAPAMNDRMWAHAATVETAAVLSERGVQLLGPAVGPLAVGEGEGPGRMVEPETLVEWVGRALGTAAAAPIWRGRRVLVTAGPTREAVDPVRYLGNRSSGKMGFALARAAWLRGCEVDLVTGPVSLPDLPGIRVHRVESAEAMYEAVCGLVANADLSVFAAAVADFRPAEPVTQKVKRSQHSKGWGISLTENPDLARDSIPLRKQGSQALGFALETHDLVSNARRKLEGKGLDWIFANLAAPGIAFESDANEGLLMSRKDPNQPVALPVQSKAEIARRILDLLEPDLNDRMCGV